MGVFFIKMPMFILTGLLSFFLSDAAIVAGYLWMRFHLEGKSIVVRGGVLTKAVAEVKALLVVAWSVREYRSNHLLPFYEAVGRTWFSIE